MTVRTNGVLLPTRESVTIDFLVQNDGKLVWIRDDYLSMNGIQGKDSLYYFLEHVTAVKAEARSLGVRFVA